MAATNRHRRALFCHPHNPFGHQCNTLHPARELKGSGGPEPKAITINLRSSTSEVNLLPVTEDTLTLVTLA